LQKQDFLISEQAAVSHSHSGQCSGFTARQNAPWLHSSASGRELGKKKGINNFCRQKTADAIRSIAFFFVLFSEQNPTWISIGL